MSTQFPRLLIISPSVFNPYTGGGITFTNLFRGWPSDKIAALHTDQNAPSIEICRNYYHLTVDEIGWLPPIRYLLQRQKRGSARLPQTPTVGGGERRLSRAILSTISFEGLQDSLRITPKLSQWFDEYQPEVIYTILGSRAFIRLAAWAQKRSNARLAVHIMDDWPETRYRRGLLAPLFHAKLQSDLRELIAGASGLFAISPKMAEVYSKRYGRRFKYFSNALDASSQLPLARKDWKRKGSKFRLVYAGSIVENAQLSSLLDVCAAAERIAPLVECELIIYASPEIQSRYAPVFARFAKTRFVPSLTDENLVQSLAEADLLLLPVNFDRESADYVRYSNPTKLPAYLLSGSPILAYGPRGVDQIDRAVEDGWGYCVSERRDADLELALRRLSADEDLRQALGAKAQLVAQRDHEIRIIRPAFQQALRELAQPG